MTLTPTQAEFLRWARVVRLATIQPDGSPHVVPVCPVLDGGTVLVALESGTAKLRNVRADPRVALAGDEYREDWDGLAGLIVRGRATFLDGDAWTRARELLYEKFRQYEPMAPIEDGQPIVAIAIEDVASWGL